MKRLSLIILIYVVMGLTSGCGSIESGSNSEPAKSVYQRITAEQAKAMMDDGNPYVLLDVRTEEEYRDGHIEGALLIPDYEIKDRVEAELPDKSARILIYCRSGNRSASAARAMIDMGYTGVYDFGGINGWPYGTVGE
jgi:rhodanese-related sulfurtransferase